MYNPQFEITPDLLRLITEATEIRAWIANAVVDVTWLPALQRESAARMAHSSTAIEGNPLTLPEVEALARGEEIGIAEKAKREVVNYLAAMRWIWNRSARESIQEPDVLRLHGILTRKLLPEQLSGRYKKKLNRVVDYKGRAIYMPPPPAQAAPLTRGLLSWMNSNPSQKIHPVVSSAVVHHRLVSIHPFSDGNGRMARALGVWILYTRGFDTHHLFALDEYFEEDRRRYYEKIQQARELDDDLTHWLEYVAEGIVQTLNKTKERIQSLRVAAKAPKMALTKRQEDVLRFLGDKGRAKSPDMEKSFRLTRSRVSQIVKPLVEAGLVKREGQTRSTVYRLG